jgi:DNA-binding NarL/FixJ family response regulator
VVTVTEGFELAGTASSGEEGVERAAATQPDLVLIDLRMSGITGREAAARIQEARPETNIILMTGDSSACNGADPSGWAIIDKRVLMPSELIAAWDRLGSR